MFLSVFRHKNNNWFCFVLKHQIFKELWPVHSGGQHAPATLAEKGQNDRKQVKNVILLVLQYCKYILCYVIWFLAFYSLLFLVFGVCYFFKLNSFDCQTQKKQVRICGSPWEGPRNGPADLWFFMKMLKMRRMAGTGFIRVWSGHSIGSHSS